MEDTTQELAQTLNINGVPYVAAPAGYNVQRMKDAETRPLRDEAPWPIKLSDNDSFVKYLTVHATRLAAVYLSTTWPDASVVATAFCDDGNKETTSWRDKQVVRIARTSSEFVDWECVDGKDMRQLEFARFLDKHIHNIFVPEGTEKPVTAADLLKFVSCLSDIRKVTFKKSVNLDNGRVELNYVEEDDQASGKVEMPRRFFIKLQPVRGYDAVYCFEVALRYQITDGTKLTFTLELRGLDLVFEAIRKDITDDIAKKIADAVKAGELPDIPVYYCE